MNRSSSGAGWLWRLSVVVFCMAALMACTDSVSERVDATDTDAVEAPVAEAALDDSHAPSGSEANAQAQADLNEHLLTDEAIAEQQTFSEEQLVALAEANVACEVLTAEDLAEVFDVEFTEGRFRWLETELRRAPASLQGICAFYATSLPASTSPRSLFLRIYDSSPLVWALNRRDDEDYTRRFHHRPIEDAPEIAERAYRRPQGADSFEATCADLGQHIACLWAHFHLTEGWVEKDVEIMSRLADRLAKR